MKFCQPAKLISTHVAIILVVMSTLGNGEPPAYSVDQDLLDSVKKFLSAEKFNSTALNSIVTAGKMGGFYTADQLFGLINALNQSYPQYITATIPVGRSYLDRQIVAYQLGETKSTVAKSIVLFTALHHSREPVSLAMIIKITLTKLYEIIHRGPEAHFFDFSDILFLPIVNIDGYAYITEHYGKPNWETDELKRKNFNHTVPCKAVSKHDAHIMSGVDLNRNYDYKFGLDEEGSVADPCDEIYRGAAPFSEPETQAVKYLVEKSGKVVSAMNFHAYGNLWISPYCYYKGSDYEKLMAPEVFRFYKTFEAEIQNLGFNKTGNAEETIHYVANGEASDWMLGRHGIISFSPELGNDQSDTDTFFPPKNKIPEVLDFEYPVIKTFFAYHRAIIQNVKINIVERQKSSVNQTAANETQSINDAGILVSSFSEPERQLELGFEQRGIIDMHSLRVVIKYVDPNFGKEIERVYFASGRGNSSEIQIKQVPLKKKLILKKLITIKKLSQSQFVFLMKGLVRSSFRVLFFKGKKKVFEISSAQDQAYVSLIAVDIKQKQTYLAFLFIFVVAFILISCWISRRRGRDQDYIMSPPNEASFEHQKLQNHP